MAGLQRGLACRASPGCSALAHSRMAAAGASVPGAAGVASKLGPAASSAPGSERPPQNSRKRASELQEARLRTRKPQNSRKRRRTSL